MTVARALCALAVIVWLAWFLFVARDAATVNGDSERDLFVAQRLADGIWPEDGPAIADRRGSLRPGWYALAGAVLASGAAPSVIIGLHAVLTALAALALGIAASAALGPIAAVVSVCTLLVSKGLTEHLLLLQHTGLAPALVMAWMAAVLNGCARPQSPGAIAAAFAVIGLGLNVHLLFVAFVPVTIWQALRLLGPKALRQPSGALALGVGTLVMLETARLAYVLVTHDPTRVYGTGLEVPALGSLASAHLQRIASAGAEGSLSLLAAGGLAAGLFGVLTRGPRPAARRLLTVQVIISALALIAMAAVSPHARYHVVLWPVLVVAAAAHAEGLWRGLAQPTRRFALLAALPLAILDPLAPFPTTLAPSDPSRLSLVEQEAVADWIASRGCGAGCLPRLHHPTTGTALRFLLATRTPSKSRGPFPHFYIGVGNLPALPAGTIDAVEHITDGRRKVYLVSFTPDRPPGRLRLGERCQLELPYVHAAQPGPELLGHFGLPLTPEWQHRCRGAVLEPAPRIDLPPSQRPWLLLISGPAHPVLRSSQPAVRPLLGSQPGSFLQGFWVEPASQVTSIFLEGTDRWTFIDVL